jgi:adenine-specific DNA-methyltransferase
MARRKKSDATPIEANAIDYRYPNEKRRNIPPGRIAGEGVVPKVPKVRYFYSAHLPPALQFDTTGKPDKLNALIEKATRSPLSATEAGQLREALQRSEPWLEWSGKREKPWFDVEPVALHMHERISTQAILRVASREDVQRDLFADPQQDYAKAVQFYQHDVDWANRLILGDSLQVMASLARREGLAGKVQMIYLDPPYGIRFGSNFQPQFGQRDVKDSDQDLTREPETVKAYRDTWTLGIHSYLAYLRDRLAMAKELLADTGSIFVQISDENLHRLRCVMDEVFGTNNFVGIISFQKTGGIETNLLTSTVDFLLFYTKDKTRMKFRKLFEERTVGDTSLDRYDMLLDTNGAIRRISQGEMETGKIPEGAKRVQLFPLYSDGASKKTESFHFRGTDYMPRGDTHWKTDPTTGLPRLANSERVEVMGSVVRYRRFAEDFPVIPITDRWESMQVGVQRIYVVQTATSVVERCLLMTTDPGDLVLDPTCGSGTTAYVAEQWGRRWITCDSIRGTQSDDPHKPNKAHPD